MKYALDGDGISSIGDGLFGFDFHDGFGSGASAEKTHVVRIGGEDELFVAFVAFDGDNVALDGYGISL
jgi:hypothetical protein